MTTAEHAVDRVVYDADSHIMEPPSWLDDFASADLKDAMHTIPIDKLGGRLAEWAKLAEAGAHPPEQVTALEANVLGGPKGYEALGAFNSQERSRTLDLTGIDAQLVFSTFSSLQFSGIRDPELLYEGALAHNRAMGAWCSDDPRLLGVAVVPMFQPDRVEKAARDAIEVGCKAIGVPPKPAGDRSPGHPDLDPFWATLEEAGIPFMVHIGPFHVRPAYMNNGHPAPVDFIGSGEGVQAKDYPNIHHDVEEFLTAICFDGVFERFPGLRGGVIEFGADWVPGFIRRLDHTLRMWAKSTPELNDLHRKPSEYFDDQLFFTPAPFEDVGELIRESSDRLYCFNTDYPHVEGSRDPFGKFAASLGEQSDETLDRFYRQNFLDMMGSAVA
ncbi:MAG: amidohydrolase [Acidimicrobiia bacterium]|nr:amidohydrolase [Acidimicrobiia bacterium]